MQLLLEMKLLCGMTVPCCAAAAANVSAGACLSWHSAHAHQCNCHGMVSEDSVTSISSTAMISVFVDLSK